jgi:hypothetical protein
MTTKLKRLLTFKMLKPEKGWPYSRQHTYRLIKEGRCKCWDSPSQRPRWLAGAPGFEPGNGGIKSRCQENRFMSAPH